MAELPESYELTFDPQRIDAVAAHAFLMAVVVVETVIITLSMRRKEGGVFPANVPRPSIKLRRLFSSSSQEAAAFSS